MNKSIKTKKQIFRDAFSLFLEKDIPDDIFTNYMRDLIIKDGEPTMIFQSWILNNMKKEISDWATAIGIIESVELMYEEAKSNGNLMYP